MSARDFAGWCCRFYALLMVLLIVSAGARADDEDMGWTPEHIPPKDPWHEGSFELPEYPAEQRLVQISVLSGDYPYDVFVDTGSLDPGKDGVVRYTVVVRSHAGAENIAFEGIHCKERTFRRYAYGSDDSWRRVDGGDWQALKPGGMGHYRFVLYRDYVCDPFQPSLKVSEMIRRMRYSGGIKLDD